MPKDWKPISSSNDLLKVLLVWRWERRTYTEGSFLYYFSSSSSCFISYFLTHIFFTFSFSIIFLFLFFSSLSTLVFVFVFTIAFLPDLAVFLQPIPHPTFFLCPSHSCQRIFFTPFHLCCLSFFKFIAATVPYVYSSFLFISIHFIPGQSKKKN